MIKTLEKWALEPKFERWGFNAAFAAMTLSGAAYFGMKYLMATDDPFAVVNHPWEPTMLAMHVVAGPVAIAFFSLAFRSHGLPRIWQATPLNRKSGLAAGAVFVVLVGSGYLNQVTTEPEHARGVHLDAHRRGRRVRRRLRDSPGRRVPRRLGTEARSRVVGTPAQWRTAATSRVPGAAGLPIRLL